MHVGMFQALVCSVYVCINAGFIASDWAWLHEPIVGYCEVGPGCCDRRACPGCGVTFEPCQVAFGRSKVMPCQSVNEALYVSVIEGTIRLDGR